MFGVFAADSESVIRRFDYLSFIVVAEALAKALHGMVQPRSNNFELIWYSQPGSQVARME